MMAMLFMLCDHMWATVVPAGNDWLTCIGRLAYPIFAFQISESFAHVPDDAFKKLYGRLSQKYRLTLCTEEHGSTRSIRMCCLRTS